MTARRSDAGDLTGDLRALWNEVEVLCTDYELDLSSVVLAVDDELTDDEARALLTEVILRIRAGGEVPTGDHRTRLMHEIEGLVTDAVERRSGRASVVGDGPKASEPRNEIGPARTGADGTRRHLEVFPYAGLDVRPVRPTPVFLGQEVSLTEGFVDVRDLAFWEDNHRLEIDLETFRRREKHEPTVDELRRMLWPKGDSPKDDVYKIKMLADDIAARGVQHAPVIDYWGTAWDGNRRIAACLYVLANDYDDAEKKRARFVRVWQTDQHSTPEQISAIVTSLNFGEEHKLPWPEYVRARQVYDAYVERRDLAASHRVLTDRDETRIRQAVAADFGIKTSEVTRFCKMVVWALEFADYHREQDRDEAHILERTNKLFQYFYELDSGRGDDKLATKLRDDDGFRAVVFDLMLDGKFKNWSQIRDLRRVFEAPAAMDTLKRAHAETSSATGRVLVGDAIDLARQRSIVLRQAGMSDELARVAKWLNDDATVSVLRKIDAAVLREFRDAARAVDGMITSIVEPTMAASDG